MIITITTKNQICKDSKKHGNKKQPTTKITKKTSSCQENNNSAQPNVGINNIFKYCA